MRFDTPYTGRHRVRRAGRPAVCALCRVEPARFQVEGGPEGPTVCELCVLHIPTDMIGAKTPP